MQKISVVMPIYNGEKHMDKAIESILNQTYNNIELIIVNDASTDDSLTKCEEWANKDSRVKVCSLEENQGAGAARNRGIEVATGDYLTFVDSDDDIASDLYEKLLCDEDDIYDEIVWGVTEKYYDKDENLVSENILTVSDAIYKDAESVRKSVIELEDKTLFGYQWNHMYKLSMIKGNDIKFEKAILYEDFFFNMRAIEYAETMKVSSYAGYNYSKRTSGDNITNKFVDNYFALSRRRVKEMYEAYKRWGLDTQAVKDSCANRYLRYCLSALARNCSKEMDYDHDERLEFIKRVRQDKLYRELVRGANIKGKANKTLFFMIERMMFSGCLAMGKSVYALKKHAPGAYSKGTRIKG